MLRATDPEGKALTFTAANLPAGAARAMAGGMSRNVTIGDIVVNAAAGMNEQALAMAVRREIVAALEEAA